jgi:hypothetical protein
MNRPGTTKTLGIITIATGKYFEEFIPTLKVSIDQYFNFPGYQVHFYCFTDSQQAIAGITNIPIKHFSWPFSTLLRYRWIEQNLSKLQSHDFLLYMDADMRVVSTPPQTTFVPGLIAVRHPGYIRAPGAFEIDRQDSCYVPPPLRKHYYQGCFWGGQSAQFSELITTLSQMVHKDLGMGLIPIWHDESYLNKYLSTQSCEPLPSTYAWPEAQPHSQAPYILHLEKKHQVIRQDSMDRLNIDALLKGGDINSELAIYQKLYLEAHEKCQRLESRLAQKNIGISRIREWLAYYKKDKPG